MTPVEVLTHYRSCLEALDALKRSHHPMIGTGAISPASRFFGMTVAEFDDAVAAMERELEIEIVLMLAASFEALFQQDLQDRIRRKKKDPVSKAIRRWWYSRPRHHPEWINMESLLDALKAATGVNSQVVGRMKSLYLFRHWVAHGRYWVEKSGLGRVDPFTAWQIASAAFAVLPGFTSLPPW